MGICCTEKNTLKVTIMEARIRWIVMVLFVLCTSCQDQKTVAVEPEMRIGDIAANKINHGEYLVNILGCTDCHTPKKMTAQGPVPDMDKYLMGFDGSAGLPTIPRDVPLGPWVLFNGELTMAVGPWGTSYAGNLTSDATGIGNWTLPQFTKALKEGKYKGLDNTRPIMPPMPVEAYKHLSDADVEAIFAYLQTVTPIDNVVPAYQPPAY